ncbi:hypothetical protein [Nonomuraea sp. NPDC052265]|uniref:hypothetical protein n=1 Tax=Nonomuraea sp. NPDC052265 TaxID=3364374 RepID=UPI0037C72D45
MTVSLRPVRRRRRLLIALAVLLLVVVAGSLLVNAELVTRQSAEATGNPTLPFDGGNIYVRQDGPSDAPALFGGVTFL